MIVFGPADFRNWVSLDLADKLDEFSWNYRNVLRAFDLRTQDDGELSAAVAFSPFIFGKERVFSSVASLTYELTLKLAQLAQLQVLTSGNCQRIRTLLQTILDLVVFALEDDLVYLVLFIRDLFTID